MVRVRRSTERGHFDHGWLDTYHTFSFGDYRDPAWVRYRTLRVLNEDRIAPGGEFGAHPHRDMEILTYLIDGALAHRDSLGHGSTIGPGEWQRMTAGKGIMHAEANASKTDPVHLLQIWILPDAHDLEPGYEQKSFAGATKPGQFVLVASPDAREGSMRIHQDADVLIGQATPGTPARHALAEGRSAWIQVVRGQVRVAGETLGTGDALGVDDVSEIVIEATVGSSEFPAEVLLFDLG
ncbi:pirin family protein [Isosphaeraceae bacterium EP7]